MQHCLFWVTKQKKPRRKRTHKHEPTDSGRPPITHKHTSARSQRVGSRSMSTGLERSAALCTHNTLSRQGSHVVAAMRPKKKKKESVHQVCLLRRSSILLLSILCSARPTSCHYMPDIASGVTDPARCRAMASTRRAIVRATLATPCESSGESPQNHAGQSGHFTMRVQ
jgi:hypothetical protein